MKLRKTLINKKWIQNKQIAIKKTRAKFEKTK
jgi:hypothetical protein